MVAKRDGVQRGGLILQSLVARDATNHGVEIVVANHQHAIVRLLFVVGAVGRLHLQTQRRFSSAALPKNNRGRWMRGFAEYFSKVGVAACVSGLRQHWILRGLLGGEGVGLKSMAT